MAEKKIKIKKRNPVVIKIYKIFFIAVFILWCIFALKLCLPTYLPFYNFKSDVPASYESYEEYIKAIKKYEEECDAEHRKQMFWKDFWAHFIRDSGAGYVDMGGGGVFNYDYGNTNIQVDGVNEGDVIKNDGQFLYILSEHPSIKLDTYPYILLEGAIAIVETSPSGEMYLVAKIELVSGKAGESKRKYGDIYISGQNLVVLSYEYDYGDYSSVCTWADIYDITDKYKPVHKRIVRLDGSLKYSREQNGILYLFTVKTMNYYYFQSYYYNDYYGDYIQRPEMTDQEKYVPSYYDTVSGEKKFVPVENLRALIPKAKKNNYSSWISTINIAAIELNSDKPVEVSAYTYADDDYFQLYMSAENNVYLTRNKWEDGISYTDILKLSVDKTDIKYATSIKVPGYMHNQFSADEYKGNLRIATTEWNKGNHLFILDENLKIISYIMRMAIREQIKSVRFDGDIGYIITFENIDPLFILDLSDPQSPEIKAEINDPAASSGVLRNEGTKVTSPQGAGNLTRKRLKIPGFSTYMHPLGNGLLLGVGENTDIRYYTDEYGNEFEWTANIGIKASLFDVSDPYNPIELSALKLGGVSSSTDIGINHKSFLNIPRYSMFSMRGKFTNIAQTERTDDIKIQALLISYSKENGLKFVQAFDGIDCDYPKNATSYNNYHTYSEINRITYINNILYHFDGESINAYDMNDNYKKLGSVYYK